MIFQAFDIYLGVTKGYVWLVVVGRIPSVKYTFF